MYALGTSPAPLLEDSAVGRFDSISAVIRLVFDLVGVKPQPWMAYVGFAILLVLFGPSVRRSLATTRARKLVLGLADLDAETRTAQVAQILALVDGNAIGLIAITDEAIRRRQPSLAREAYRRLRLTGKQPVEQLRLEEALNGPLPRHLDEELETLERLLDAGAIERLNERLSRAIAVFPGDPRLTELARRVRQNATNRPGDSA
ncbi:MAG: hypothetical protein GXP62_05510 [Oligoflexia bacterium]|nr:hypothetical protein [Oligoflexia bacterium]